MTLTTDEINYSLDELYPTSGTYGYGVLLSNTLVNTTVSAIDTGTEVITTTNTDPNYITGSRIRFSTSGSLPTVSGTALNASTDYWLRRITDQTFKAYRSYADAVADTNVINFTDSGSGTLTINEQLLTVNDALDVLINKEISHPAYTRKAFTSLPAAANGSKTLEWIFNNTDASTMSYRHRLIIRGGSATIGNTTGNKNQFFTESTEISVLSGEQASLSVILGLANQ